MDIHLNMFSVGSGNRSEIEQLAGRFAPIFRAQKGFKSITFFEADARATGEYGSLSLWDTREDDDEAADAALRPPLQQAMGGAGLQMRGTPMRRIGEVFEPKA